MDDRWREFAETAVDIFDAASLSLNWLEAGGAPPDCAAAVSSLKKEFKRLVKRHHRGLRSPPRHQTGAGCVGRGGRLGQCFMLSIIQQIALSPPQYHLQLVRALLGPFVRYDLFALGRGGGVYKIAGTRDDFEVEQSCAHSIFYVWTAHLTTKQNRLSSAARKFAARYCVVAAMRGDAVAAPREEVTAAVRGGAAGASALLAELACFLEARRYNMSPQPELDPEVVEFPEALRLLNSGSLDELTPTGRLSPLAGDVFRWWPGCEVDRWRDGSPCETLPMPLHVWKLCTTREPLRKLPAGDLVALFGTARILDMLATEHISYYIDPILARLAPLARGLVLAADVEYVKTTAGYALGKTMACQLLLNFGFALTNLVGFGAASPAQQPARLRSWLEIRCVCVATDLTGDEILARINTGWPEFMRKIPNQAPASAAAELVVCGKLLELRIASVSAPVREKVVCILKALEKDVEALVREVPDDTLSALRRGLAASREELAARLSREAFQWVFGPSVVQLRTLGLPTDEPPTV